MTHSEAEILQRDADRRQRNRLRRYRREYNRNDKRLREISGLPGANLMFAEEIDWLTDRQFELSELLGIPDSRGEPSDG